MNAYYFADYSNSLYLMHHGIKGQKWGVRRYQDENGHYTSEGKIRRQVLTASNNVGKRLTTKAQPFVAEPIDIFKVQARGSLSRYEAEKCARLAKDIFKTAQKHEPKITGDVIDAISKVNAKMYGLDHRMKQPTSLAAKIGSDAKSDGVSFKQASNDIHDVIRYTAVSDPSNFSQTYNSVKKQLEANGYSEIQCKNYFKRFNDGKVSHKAVQSVYSTPDGVSFELQFQTPESQAVKELKIPLYEEARKISTSEARRQQLSKQMRMLGDNIEDPDEVFDILEHDEIHSDKAFDTRTYLSHHGIKGQKWGVRRYQDYDGSLTLKGRERYGKKDTIKNNKESKVQQALKYIKYSPAWEEEFRMRYGKPNRYDPEGLGDGILVNKNMTLTDRGLKEFKNAYDFRYSKKGSDALKDKDTELLDKIIETGTIPKDTIIYRRSSNLNEPLDKNRKYVSLIPRDTNNFADIIEEGSKVATITYKAKKDITIAPEQEVQDYIFSKMPRKEAEIYKNIRDGANFIRENNKTVWYKEDPASIAILSDRYLDNLDYKMSGIYAAGMNWNKYSNSNDVIDHFSKLGYDAIPDVVDGMYRTNTFSNNLNIPIGSAIILNPKETLTQKSKKVETMGLWM